MRYLNPWPRRDCPIGSRLDTDDFITACVENAAGGATRATPICVPRLRVRPDLGMNGAAGCGRNAGLSRRPLAAEALDRTGKMARLRRTSLRVLLVGTPHYAVN